MNNEDTLFEIGQVWACKSSAGGTYEVYEIEPRGSEFVVKTMNYFEGKFVRYGHFLADINCKASNLSSSWYIVKTKAPKKFTRVSPRTLRKREREQMAARALTHRLTE